jgi:WD40 repeat protein
MANGDSIIGEGWYNEMLILSVPDDINSFYLFTLGGSSSISGVYYSLADTRLNSGLGDITQKNVLISSFHTWDAMAAVRHANGRDWWLVTRELIDTIVSGGNNFHVFHISPFGITEDIQSLGLSRYSDLGNLTFSPQGDRLLFTSYNGIIVLFDFDRCTGILSNQVIIDQQNTDIGYMGACFSPNGQRIYVSTNNEESVLYQYDLTAPVIRYTQLPLDTNRECLYSGGQLRLAPDGKVYWSSGWYNGHQFPYPYQDTMYHPDR